MREFVKCKGDPVESFDLYNMTYKFVKGEAPKWKEGNKCLEIVAGDVQRRRLSDLIETGTLTRRNLEILAVECMGSYFGHLDCKIKPVGTKYNMVSTEKGSIALISNTGGTYNVIVSNSHDSFLFTRLMELWPTNHGMAEVGSRTFMMYEKFGYDLVGVTDGVAEMTRFNFKSDRAELDIKSVAKQFGLTVWELEYDSTVSLHPTA